MAVKAPARGTIKTIILPASNQEPAQEVFLVNFGEEIPTGKFAVMWGQTQKLCVAPQEVFRRARNSSPSLHEQLEEPELRLVSLACWTIGSQKRVEYSQWFDSFRHDGVDLFSHPFDASNWFLFVTI